ncbi:dual specificity protein phosphatase 6-like isoform X2 [Halichondria panicea]|uniref:dual specificity protein phosphatase 6-like isoform X2 n=1 Tax=Halichondria panicea TaxID=6063 RepID=UPI00312B4813
MADTTQDSNQSNASNDVERKLPPIKMTSLKLPEVKVHTIHPHDLARDLHTMETYFMLDCRPVLAYDSCHIAGAVNVNIVGLLKKRFVAGKIGLADLVTSDEGKEKFQSCWSCEFPMVVYDDSTADMTNLSSSHSVWLVLSALEKMGRCPYLLQGGLTEFNVLHPSLCEINLPKIKKGLGNTPQQRATTPGMRDQPLDWKTAPPVHVLSFLVLGSEKDAQSKDVMKEFSVRYVLNVTPNCPNYFKEDSVEYLRISVTDTGSQKLITHFSEAFAYIEKARMSKCTILIHCMAGISRSVTVTIAYLMQNFGMSMQEAYQFVKDKRPAISPNLNFMGQLVAFEKQLKENQSSDDYLDIENFLPTSDQEYLSAEIKRRGTFSKNDSFTKPNISASKSADSAVSANDPCPDQVIDTGIKPFTLKMPGPRKCKKQPLKDDITKKETPKKV